jgi:hypothetical protein
MVPASELRTFSRSFFCFGFLSGDRKKMKNWACLTKNAKNIGRITDNSDFIAIFALINTNDD